MDSNLLRLILLILGIALVAGIYLWDRRKHVDSRFFTRQSVRRSRRHDTSLFDTQDSPVDEPGEVNSDDNDYSGDEVLTPVQAGETERFSFSVNEESMSGLDKDHLDDLSFSAKNAFQEFEAGAKLPTKILQVNIVTRNNDISGQMILDLASELDMQLGEFNIFHRMDPKTGKSVFSMANIVEPGSFDADKMQDFKTPGLTIFSQLPAPVDCLTVFSEMMNVAKRISYIVGAEMQDSSHSAMTSQSIEHERDALVEYKHQLQLAMQSL